MRLNLAPIDVQPRKLSDHVYEALCNAIVEGELAQGQRLREAEVGAALGVSRTPVREAFARLEGQHLLEKGPSGAYFVARWDRKTLEEVSTLRAALEGLAVSLASQNLSADDFHHLEDLITQVEAAIQRKDYERLIFLDIAFHSYVWSRAGHGLLEETLEQLKPQVRFFMYLARPIDESYSAESHRKLVDVLREGDPEKAMNAVREHIITAAERAIAQSEL